MLSTDSTKSVDTFFDNTGGGVGAPSAKLSAVDDFVKGEIVDQAIVDKKKFGTDEIEKDKKTGEPLTQLVVIIQTDKRNWDGVAKLPKNEDGSAKAASEDDGRRAVYVAPFTNIHAAVGDAVIKGTGEKGPVRNGGDLGVKVIELRDTGKGNPLKIHAAVYSPPAASSAVFPTESAPATEQAAPAATPAAAPAAAPAQTDPWATSATPAEPGQTEKPPF